MIEKGAILDGKTLTSVLLYARMLDKRREKIAAFCRIFFHKKYEPIPVISGAAGSRSFSAAAAVSLCGTLTSQSTFLVFSRLKGIGVRFPSKPTVSPQEKKEGRTCGSVQRKGQVVQQRQGLRIHRTRRRAGCIRSLLSNSIGRIQNAQRRRRGRVRHSRGSERSPGGCRSPLPGKQPPTTLLSAIGPGRVTARPLPGGKGGSASPHPCRIFHNYPSLQVRAPRVIAESPVRRRAFWRVD